MARGQVSGILARWEDGSVGLRRQDGQAMEHRDGGQTADAQGPFGVGQLSGILARSAPPRLELSFRVSTAFTPSSLASTMVWGWPTEIISSTVSITALCGRGSFSTSVAITPLLCASSFIKSLLPRKDLFLFLTLRGCSRPEGFTIGKEMRTL